MPKRPPRQPRRWSLQDAKNRFSQVVNAATRGIPQIVTRRGIETAVVISHADYQRLEAPRPRSLAEHLLRIPSTRAGEAFPRLPVRPREVDI